MFGCSIDIDIPIEWVTLRPLLSVFSPYQTELLQGNEKYLYLVWCAVKKILCFFSCDLYQGLTGIWECHVTKKTFSTKDVLFVMCPSLKWNNPASCWIHWITEIFAKRKTPLVPHKTVHQVLGCGNKKNPTSSCKFSQYKVAHRRTGPVRVITQIWEPSITVTTGGQQTQEERKWSRALWRLSGRRHVYILLWWRRQNGIVNWIPTPSCK